MTTPFAIPTPYGIEFSQWAAVVSEQLASYGVPSPPSEDLWKQWASEVAGSSQLTVPDPYGFSTWQDWAAALVGTLT